MLFPHLIWPARLSLRLWAVQPDNRGASERFCSYKFHLSAAIAKPQLLLLALDQMITLLPVIQVMKNFAIKITVFFQHNQYRLLPAFELNLMIEFN